MQSLIENFNADSFWAAFNTMALYIFISLNIAALFVYLPQLAMKAEAFKEKESLILKIAFIAFLASLILNVVGHK